MISLFWFIGFFARRLRIAQVLRSMISSTNIAVPMLAPIMTPRLT